MVTFSSDIMTDFISKVMMMYYHLFLEADRYMNINIIEGQFLSNFIKKTP